MSMFAQGKNPGGALGAKPGAEPGGLAATGSTSTSPNDPASNTPSSLGKNKPNTCTPSTSDKDSPAIWNKKSPAVVSHPLSPSSSSSSSRSSGSPSKRKQYHYADDDENLRQNNSETSVSAATKAAPETTFFSSSISPSAPASVTATSQSRTIQIPAADAAPVYVPASPTAVASLAGPSPPVDMSPAIHAAAAASTIAPPYPGSVFVTQHQLQATVDPILAEVKKQNDGLASVSGKMDALVRLITQLQTTPVTQLPSTPQRSSSPSAGSVTSNSTTTPHTHTRHHKRRRTHTSALDLFPPPIVPPSSSSVSFNTSPTSTSTSLSPSSCSSASTFTFTSTSASTSTSTSTSTSKPKASTRRRDLYNDWKDEPANTTLHQMLEQWVIQVWDVVTADKEKAKLLNYTGHVDDENNGAFVNTVLAAIGSPEVLSTVPDGYIKHAIEQHWRNNKKKLSYAKMPDEAKIMKKSRARKRERFKKRHENRLKACRVAHKNFLDSKGIVNSEAIPGPEINYLELYRAISEEEMHSHCDSDRENKVIYKHSVPHRSALCEAWIRILDKMSKRSTPIGSDAENTTQALAKHLTVNAQLLYSKGVPHRMLNGVVLAPEDDAATATQTVEAVSVPASSAAPATPAASATSAAPAVSSSARADPADPSPTHSAPSSSSNADMRKRKRPSSSSAAVSTAATSPAATRISSSSHKSSASTSSSSSSSSSSHTISNRSIEFKKTKKQRLVQPHSHSQTNNLNLSMESEDNTHLCC